VLTHSIKNQFVEAVDALINAGADPNLSSKKGVTPISAAAHKGNVIIMEKLILAGAAVNAVNQSGSTALIQVYLYFKFVS
jgi:ankyrin repeat protein